VALKKRLKIPEGSVFLVPLTDGDYGFGVLIRTSGDGSCYGAFFGPSVKNSNEVDFSCLVEEGAILRCRFGDYGLHNQLWPVIGSIPDWGSNRWGLPQFARHHDNPELRYVTTYDDRLDAIEEVLVPVKDALNLFEDTQFGSGSVEIRLTKLLRQPV
jgi:hypothetical protein